MDKEPLRQSGKGFRVVWSPPEGGPDLATPTISSAEQARALADMLDKLYPETKHRVEEVS